MLLKYMDIPQLVKLYEEYKNDTDAQIDTYRGDIAEMDYKIKSLSGQLYDRNLILEARNKQIQKEYNLKQNQIDKGGNTEEIALELRRLNVEEGQNDQIIYHNKLVYDVNVKNLEDLKKRTRKTINTLKKNVNNIRNDVVLYEKLVYEAESPAVQEKKDAVLNTIGEELVDATSKNRFFVNERNKLELKKGQKSFEEFLTLDKNPNLEFDNNPELQTLYNIGLNEKEFKRRRHKPPHYSSTSSSEHELYKTIKRNLEEEDRALASKLQREFDLARQHEIDASKIPLGVSPEMIQKSKEENIAKVEKSISDSKANKSVVDTVLDTTLDLEAGKAYDKHYYDNFKTKRTTFNHDESELIRIGPKGIRDNRGFLHHKEDNILSPSFDRVSKYDDVDLEINYGKMGLHSPFNEFKNKRREVNERFDQAVNDVKESVSNKVNNLYDSSAETGERMKMKFYQAFPTIDSNEDDIVLPQGYELEDYTIPPEVYEQIQNDPAYLTQVSRQHISQDPQFMNRYIKQYKNDPDYISGLPKKDEDNAFTWVINKYGELSKWLRSGKDSELSNSIIQAPIPSNDSSPSDLIKESDESIIAMLANKFADIYGKIPTRHELGEAIQNKSSDFLDFFTNDKGKNVLTVAIDDDYDAAPQSIKIGWFDKLKSYFPSGDKITKNVTNFIKNHGATAAKATLVAALIALGSYGAYKLYQYLFSGNKEKPKVTKVDHNLLIQLLEPPSKNLPLSGIDDSAYIKNKIDNMLNAKLSYAWDYEGYLNKRLPSALTKGY